MSSKTTRRRRQRFAKAAREAGWTQQRIDEVLAAPPAAVQQALNHFARAARPAWTPDGDEEARGVEYLERLQEQTYADLAVDDSKHHPAHPDPLLTGDGRATGATAKAVTRTKAITRFEYDRLQETG